MNIDNLTIKEAREIASFFSYSPSGHVDRLAPDGDTVIAVLQRGHVAVGKYSQKGMIGRLDDAAVIRRWGTSEGLGELAKKGPMPDSAENGPTVLDECPPVTFHIREAVSVMSRIRNAHLKYKALFNEPTGNSAHLYYKEGE